MFECNPKCAVRWVNVLFKNYCDIVLFILNYEVIIEFMFSDTKTNPSCICTLEYGEYVQVRKYEVCRNII